AIAQAVGPSPPPPRAATPPRPVQHRWLTVQRRRPAPLGGARRPWQPSGRRVDSPRPVALPSGPPHAPTLPLRLGLSIPPHALVMRTGGTSFASPTPAA